MLHRIKNLILHKQPVLNNLSAGPWLKGNQRKIAPGNAPVNTVAPAITGTPSSSNTLTCSTGTWTDAQSISFQWFNDGAVLIGKSQSTLLITSAIAVGSKLRCDVYGANPHGVTTAHSNEVTVT